jgi:adenylate kinase
MRILMVAPPGAGKGTQAERLADNYHIEHLASGEMLRAELLAGTELGEKVRQYVERGDLVPDDLVIQLVLDRVTAAAARGGYVLDGFPRTIKQAEAAHEEATQCPEVMLQAVVHLAVGRDELRRRMVHRAAVEGRVDDTAVVFEHRLAIYEEQTDPLLDFFRSRHLLVSVNGERSVDEVTVDLIAALERFVSTSSGRF